MSIFARYLAASLPGCLAASLPARPPYCLARCLAAGQLSDRIKIGSGRDAAKLAQYSRGGNTVEAPSFAEAVGIAREEEASKKRKVGLPNDHAAASRPASCAPATVFGVDRIACITSMQIAPRPDQVEAERRRKEVEEQKVALQDLGLAFLSLDIRQAHVHFISHPQAVGSRLAL